MADTKLNQMIWTANFAAKAQLSHGFKIGALVLTDPEKKWSIACDAKTFPKVREGDMVLISMTVVKTDVVEDEPLIIQPKVN